MIFLSYLFLVILMNVECKECFKANKDGCHKYPKGCTLQTPSSLLSEVTHSCFLEPWLERDGNSMDIETTKNKIKAAMDIKYEPKSSDPIFQKPKWFIMQLHPKNESQEYGILFYTQIPRVSGDEKVLNSKITINSKNVIIASLI